MMAAVREWLVSLVAVSLFLSLAQSIIPEGTLRKISSFTGGLLLLAALLQPLTGAERWEVELDVSAYEKAIAAQRLELEKTGAAQLAQEVARAAAQTVETKAAAMGHAVSVEVETKTDESGTPLPDAASIRGAYDETLSAWIAEELAIPSERQTWLADNN